MTRASATEPRRPDADIFAEARKALDDLPSVPTTVRVHVDDAVVWLTGVVDRMSQRTDAEQAVQRIEGVKEIVNKITVFDERDADALDVNPT